MPSRRKSISPTAQRWTSGSGRAQARQKADCLLEPRASPQRPALPGPDPLGEGWWAATTGWAAFQAAVSRLSVPDWPAPSPKIDGLGIQQSLLSSVQKCYPRAVAILDANQQGNPPKSC